MAVPVNIWDNLCDLYPKTSSEYKEFALLKREIILHYMVTGLELNKSRRETGIPSALAVGSNNVGTPTSNSMRRA